MSESAAEELFGLTLTQQTRHQADMLRHWQSRGEVVLRPWIEGARERYQYPGLPDWTRAILKSDNDGHSDAALDDLFDRIDVMLSSGEYEKVDDILAAMPLEGPSLTLMMGLLSVTRPAAKYLPSRVRYFNRVYRLCNAMRRDAQTLLGGLK